MSADEERTPLARAFRDGHPVVRSLFDPDTHEPTIVESLDVITARIAEAFAPIREALARAFPEAEPVARLVAPLNAEETGILARLRGPGLTGHRHPDTATEAGARDFRNDRERVLAAIVDAGPAGLTSRDLVDEGLMPSTNEAGARLIELRGGTSRFPDRLIARVVETDTGRLVRRKACAVHVGTDHALPDGWSWETPPEVRLCPCCGQAVRTIDPGDPVAD